MSRAIAPLPQCTNMAELRRQIDALDDALVPLLVQRCACMRQAARIKRSEAEVHDPARIEAIVARVRASARAEGGETHLIDLIENIYRGLIEACIGYEHGEFKRLRAGAASPGDADVAGGAA